MKAVRSRLRKRVNKDPVAAIVMGVDEDFLVDDLGVTDAEAISCSVPTKNSVHAEIIALA